MATIVPFNGVNYSIPAAGETGWGDQVSSFLIAVAGAALVPGSTVSSLTVNNLIALKETFTESSLVVAAGDTIAPSNVNFSLTSLSDVVLDATTSISNGTLDGQIIILTNVDPTYSIKIQDASNTSMNGDVILSAGESIEFKWDTALKWVEQRRSN